MLTGRNHHAVGMRAISNFDTGFPNMRGAIPRSAATLAEVLRTEGFGTYMVGKWHLAPMHETGPFLTYLAFGACHSPHQAPQAFLDTRHFRRGVGRGARPVVRSPDPPG